MKSFVHTCCLSVMCLGTPHVIAAQITTTWIDGTGNTKWTNAANWNTTVPGSADIAQFSSNTTKTPTVDANTSVGALQFLAGADAESFTGKSTLTLSSVGGLAIDNQTGLVQTFANKFALGADQTWQSTANAGGLTFNGAVNLAGHNLTLGLASSGSSIIRLAGNISGTASSLIVKGNGTLVLSGANTFSGRTSINTGILSIGSVNRVVGGTASSNLGAPASAAAGTIDLGSGALAGTLAITGVSYQITDRVINLAGTTGGGVIDASGAGGVAFTSDLTATGAGAKMFSLQGSGTNNAFGGAIVDGAGTISLTKDGTGMWTLNGSAANTFTGLTSVNAGILALAKTGGATAISGNLNIGDGLGTDTLRLGGNHQIADTAIVTVASSGIFDINGKSETIGGLRASAGAAQVQLGGGALAIDNASANSYAGSISGSGTLTKIGAGRLTLSGSSGSFSGLASVNAGIVTLQSANALGTSAISVLSGGKLEIQGGLTVSNPLSLAGSGAGEGDGALASITGVNTVTGAIALAADTRVQSNAGTLNLKGNIGGTGATMTFGGAGDINVTGMIATGTGGLVKEGSCTLHLGAPGWNSFAGATLISAGSIVADAASVFNNSAALTVSTGTLLSLNNFSQVIGHLSGGGTLDLGASGTGSLTLASGSGTFSGTFSGRGTIIIGPGAILTLGADFNAPYLNFTLAGGTLALNGHTSTFGQLQITGSSILDFGNSVASILTVNNLTFQNSGLRLSIQNWAVLADYFYAQNFTGAVPDLPGFNPQNQVSFAGFSSDSTIWQSYDKQMKPIPETASYGLILLSASLAVRAWRRRHATIAGCV